MNDDVAAPDEVKSQKSNPLQILSETRAREGAEKNAALNGLKARITALRHLDKISKGAGKPSIDELASALSAAYAAIIAQSTELQMTQSLITSTLLQSNIRNDAVLSVLQEKGIVTEEDVRAAQDTILMKHREAAALQREAMLKESVSQLQK